MKNTFLLSPLFFLFLSSCSSVSRSAENRLPASSLSSAPFAKIELPKLYEGPFELNPEGASRKPANIFLPLQYDSQEKWPLVILLHGFSGTAEAEDAYLGLSIRSSARGFILMTPEGTKVPKGTVAPDGKDLSGNPFWNATDFCCDFGQTGVDDVSYVSQLIAEAKRRYKVDSNRIYLFGHSNGGFMANRLGCEIGEEIAGIANLAGGSFLNIKNCRQPTAVPYLQIHALDDETIKYKNSFLYAGGVESVQQWVEKNKCRDPKTLQDEHDFLFLLPGTDTSEKKWENCRSGKEVAFWTIRKDDKKTKGHNPHIPFFHSTFTDAVLDFLFRQSKAGPASR